MAAREIIKQSERRDFWQGRLAEFSRYSGTQTGFCRERGICPHLLHYWRKKLSRERLRRQTKVMASSTSVEKPMASPFVAVEVASSRDFRRSLPEARWVAELILYLHAGGAR